MSRVLVTGSSGYIGRAVVGRFLAAGWDVRGFSRRPAEPGSGVEMVQGDIDDPARVNHAAAGCEVIVHLAAVVDAEAAADEHRRVGVEGTRNIVAAADAEQSVRRLVFISSSSVYAAGESLHEESSAADAPTPYGRAKLEAEDIVRRAHVPWTILRPAMVYGPSCKGNLPKMIEAIDRGRFVVPGRGAAVKSMVHVHDLAEAVFLAATRPEAARRTYNVTDGRTYTVREIADCISAALGREPAPSVSLFLLEILARAGDLFAKATRRRPLLDTRRLHTLISPAHLNSAALERELLFVPSTDLWSSAHQLIAAYRAGA